MSNINNNYNFYETLQPNQSGQNNTNNGSLNNTPVSMNPTPPTPVRATNNIPFNNNPAPSGKPHSKNVSDKSVKTTHMYALSPNETELASSREFACVFKKLGKLHNAKDMFADFFSSEGIGRFKKIPNVSVNFRVNDYLHRQYSSRDVRWSINEGFIRADDPYKVFDDVSPSEGKVNPAWFAAYSEYLQAGLLGTISVSKELRYAWKLADDLINNNVAQDDATRDRKLKRLNYIRLVLLGVRNVTIALSNCPDIRESSREVAILSNMYIAVVFDELEKLMELIAKTTDHAPKTLLIENSSVDHDSIPPHRPPVKQRVQVSEGSHYESFAGEDATLITNKDGTPLYYEPKHVKTDLTVDWDNILSAASYVPDYKLYQSVVETIIHLKGVSNHYLRGSTSNLQTKEEVRFDFEQANKFLDLIKDVKSAHFSVQESTFYFASDRANAFSYGFKV